MGTFSIWHWLIVLLIVVMVFGEQHGGLLGMTGGGGSVGEWPITDKLGTAATTTAGVSRHRKWLQCIDL